MGIGRGAKRRCWNSLWVLVKHWWLCRQHDADGSGFISYPEFEELHGFLTNMQQSFLYFDRDRGGSLSQPEVYEALQHAGNEEGLVGKGGG